MAASSMFVLTSSQVKPFIHLTELNSLKKWRWSVLHLFRWKTVETTSDVNSTLLVNLSLLWSKHGEPKTSKDIFWIFRFWGEAAGRSAWGPDGRRNGVGPRRTPAHEGNSKLFDLNLTRFLLIIESGWFSQICLRNSEMFKNYRSCKKSGLVKKS